MLVIGCAIGALVLAVLLVPEGEVATLSTYTADGRPHETQVWVVEGDAVPGEPDGAVFLRAHSRFAEWLHRLEASPQVELARRGEARAYRAEVPDPAPLREPVNRAMAAKYGVADRLLGFVLDADISVPVRLVPDPTRENAAREKSEGHAAPQ